MNDVPDQIELRIPMSKLRTPAVLMLHVEIDEFGQASAFTFEPAPGADAHKGAAAAWMLGSRMGAALLPKGKESKSPAA